MVPLRGCVLRDDFGPRIIGEGTRQYANLARLSTSSIAFWMG